MMEFEDHENDLKNDTFDSAVMEVVDSTLPRHYDWALHITAYMKLSTHIVILSYIFVSVLIPQINWEVPTLLLMQSLLIMFLGYYWSYSARQDGLHAIVSQASIHNVVLALKTKKRDEVPFYAWLVVQNKLSETGTAPIKVNIKYFLRIIGLYSYILIPPLIGWGIR